MKVKEKILYYGCIIGMAAGLGATIIGAATSNGVLLLRGVLGLGILMAVFLKVFRSRDPGAQS